jgi:hypothetical protein
MKRIVKPTALLLMLFFWLLAGCSDPAEYEEPDLIWPIHAVTVDQPSANYIEVGTNVYFFLGFDLNAGQTYYLKTRLYRQTDDEVAGNSGGTPVMDLVSKPTTTETVLMTFADFVDGIKVIKFNPSTNGSGAGTYYLRIKGEDQLKSELRFHITTRMSSLDAIGWPNAKKAAVIGTDPSDDTEGVAATTEVKVVFNQNVGCWAMNSVPNNVINTVDTNCGDYHIQLSNDNFDTCVRFASGGCVNWDWTNPPGANVVSDQIRLDPFGTLNPGTYKVKVTPDIVFGQDGLKLEYTYLPFFGFTVQ